MKPVLSMHPQLYSLPAHCFFTSSSLTGCTATRYFGSASEKVKQKVRQHARARERERDGERLPKREFGGFTNFSFIRFPIIRELDELLGEHVAAVAQDVALQLSVHVWLKELQHDGVSYSTDPNLCSLPAHWGWNINQKGQE